MTLSIIEAYACSCEKCGYKWSSFTIPFTCANKPCRSPRWNKDTPFVEPIKNSKIKNNLYPERTEQDKYDLIQSLKVLTEKPIVNKPQEILPVYSAPVTLDSEPTYQYE